jgi:uncharacterized phage protein gp47/JayE
MPTLQLRSQEQVLQRMAARVVARTSLTDLTDSSALKHLLAAFAREIDDVYFQLTRLRALQDLREAVGDDLDARAKEIVPGAVRRRGARRAVGQLVFSRATNTLTTITIPSGTSVRSRDGQVYVTTASTVISATSVEQIAGHGVGRDSAPVTATAIVAGSAGNADVGVVSSFVAKPAGIAEVINVTAFVKGVDRQIDDEFRADIVQYIASLSRSTVDALEFIVRDIEDPVTGKRVLFSHVFEDPVDRGNVIIYIDDGVGTAEELGAPIVNEILISPALGGEEFLQLDNFPFSLDAGITVTLERPPAGAVALTLGTDYSVNPASGRVFIPAPSFSGVQVGDIVRASYTPFVGLIPEVQRVVDGDPNNRAEFPGYRAAGVLVRVLSPVVRNVPVQAVLNVLPGFDQVSVANDAVTAVLDYINNLGISVDVIRNELIQRIMEVPGVYDVLLNAPADNVNVLDSQIPRVTAANVSIA